MAVNVSLLLAKSGAGTLFIHDRLKECWLDNLTRDPSRLFLWRGRLSRYRGSGAIRRDSSLDRDNST